MTDIVRINCVEDGCGTFPMDRALRDRYKRTGETFTCPAGHGQHFTGESTEKELRKRIGELKAEVQRYKTLFERYRENARAMWAERNEEVRRREYVEALLLGDVDGVVEVGDDEFMWACSCGGQGRKRFDDEAGAWEAYDGHRSRDACEASEAVVA